MLKIVYHICCGMDVHKSFVVACIASINDHVPNVSPPSPEIYGTAWLGLAENNCQYVKAIRGKKRQKRYQVDRRYL